MTAVKEEPMLVQCQLTQGTTTLTSWLDTKKPFKVGNHVTLKGLDGRWRVDSMGRPTYASNINRGWNNNI